MWDFDVFCLKVWPLNTWTGLWTRKVGWLCSAEKKMSIDIVFPQPTLPYLIGTLPGHPSPGCCSMMQYVSMLAHSCCIPLNWCWAAGTTLSTFALERQSGSRLRFPSLSLSSSVDPHHSNRQKMVIDTYFSIWLPLLGAAIWRFPEIGVPPNHPC